MSAQPKPQLRLMDGTKSILLEALPESAWRYVTGNPSGSPDFNPESAWRLVPTLFRAIDMRSGAVSSMAWGLFRPGDKKNNLKDDPAFKGFRRGLKRRLWQTSAAMDVFGAGYWALERNMMGGNLTPRYLYPPTIKTKSNASEGLTGFARQVGANDPIPLGLEEVCYFWLPGLDEVGHGPSPVSVALAAAGALRHMDAFVEAYFKRGVIKATILKVDPSTPKGDMERLESLWKSMLTSVRKAFSSIVLRSNFEPVVIGDSLKDTSAPEMTQRLREDVAVAMGIPLSLLFSNAANFATAQADEFNFVTQTVIPRCDLIAEALNDQVFESMGVEFRFLTDQLDILQTAQLQQADAVTKLTGGPVLSRNEGRAIINYDPAAPSEVIAPPPVVAAAEAKEGDTPPSELPPTPVRSVKAADDGADAQRQQIEQAHQQTIADALGQQSGAALNGDVSDPKAVAGRVKDDDATLREALTRMLIEAVTLGASEGKVSLGDAATGVDWNLVNEDARKWAEEYSYELTRGINDTTRQVLRDKIAAWIESGEPMDALEEALAPWFGEERAQVIASTEVTRSFAEGNRQAWQASKVVTGWVWKTATDDIVCDVCQPLDGTRHGLDDEMPPAHPRCRCWASPSVD